MSLSARTTPISDSGSEHAAEHLLLIAAGATHYQIVTRWKFHSLGERHGLAEYFTEAAALDIGGDGDGGLAVEVLDGRGTFAHGDLGNLFQRHHRVADGDHRQGFQVPGSQPVLGRQPHRHVARFSRRVDPVADLDARERYAQGGGGVTH